MTPRLRLWVIHGLVCLLTAAAAWALGVGTIVIHNNTDATLTIWAVNQDPSENTREVTVGPNQKRTLEWFLPMGRNEVCARPKLTQLGAICKGYWVSGQASKVQEWEIFPGDWGKSVILDGPTRSTRTAKRDFDPGRKWTVSELAEEHSATAVWTRRGKTNDFDGEWTVTTTRVKRHSQVTFQGIETHADGSRWAKFHRAGHGWYVGRLTPDLAGVVEGRAAHFKQGWSWSATIED